MLRFVRRPVQKRFRHRAIASPATKAALAAAEREAHRLGRAFTQSVDRLRAALPAEDALAALVSQGWTAVLSDLPWEVFQHTFGVEMGSALRHVMEGSAVAAAAHKPWAPMTGAPGTHVATFDMSFDLMNPRAIRAAQAHAASLVRNIDVDMRAAIRQVVIAGQQGQLDVRDQARSIRQFIGLTERQSVAVTRYRDTLERAGDTRAEAKTTAYYERSINQRALTIARTETLWAANAGQQELWAQAVEDGLLERDVLQEWITQPESNSGPCVVCEPMDGQLRAIGDAFVSPYNGQSALHPPMHPRCVCAISLAGQAA